METFVIKPVRAVAFRGFMVALGTLHDMLPKQVVRTRMNRKINQNEHLKKEE